MSTLKNNIAARRIALLASKQEVLFHASDLANWWGIVNKNTLRVTLQRYAKQGLLHRVYRGFYSLVPLASLDPVAVGAQALHRFCYLTTESVLYEHGIMSQKPSAWTFVSEKAGRLKVGEWNFKSRQLHSRHLYGSEGVVQRGNVQIATPERALADLLYFNPKTHVDKPVDWNGVRRIQKAIGYPLTPHRYAHP
ncbi:hypothetical protein HZA43_00125 [Candidatus Peregrinibacteria bacterium]|nr:hypothetical protein [Candidatus Peregrinibacteria bacterium]